MNNEPLAIALRPKTLTEYIGQSHLVGDKKPLRICVDNGQLFSMIFWGPPGVGKTTLARILASNTGAQFIELSAVSCGKADITKVITQAKDSLLKTVLFLDEIHRFNKAQQDYLLPSVEQGVITLIGATTENPSFEVISPLLSRTRVFVLKELSEDEISEVIKRAVVYLNKVHKAKITVKPDAKEWLISMANGDARQVITLIDNAFQIYHSLTLKNLKETLQNHFLRFDKQAEEHYNTISAFIKSMRASNPDAALYYLARMIDAGQDPKFIARRMVVFASEDIGMAQPTALVVANEVFRAVETIGYPECAINLAHGVVHLCLAPKNRLVYDGLRAAQADVKQYGNLPVPLSLRNAPTKLMKDLGFGTGYEMYPKDLKNMLPDKIQGKRYYQAKSK